MKKIIPQILDLLYPPRCPFCRRLLNDSGQLLCPECRGSFAGLPAVGYRREVPNIRFAVAPFSYEGAVRESLHRYKFSGVTAYARTYAEFIGKCIDENRISCDIITWVPLSRKRLRKRGYDQARLIAEELARRQRTESRQLLRKIIDNRPQSLTGSGENRKANASGAYVCAEPESVRGKRILLIDDIITTGATLSECARILKEAGAAEIFAAAAASRN